MDLVLTATGVLVHEHRGIERVVRTIATTADKVEGCRFVEPSILIDVASFLRAFARQCQQAKEEAILYPLLEAKRMSRSGYSSRVSLRSTARPNDSPGNCWKTPRLIVPAEAREKACSSCSLRNVVALYRQHLRKEDDLLLPLADEVVRERNRIVFIERSAMWRPPSDWTNLQPGLNGNRRTRLHTSVKS